MSPITRATAGVDDSGPPDDRKEATLPILKYTLDALRESVRGGADFTYCELHALADGRYIPAAVGTKTTARRQEIVIAVKAGTQMWLDARVEQLVETGLLPLLTSRHRTAEAAYRYINARLGRLLEEQ
jgi:hypothetical protein